jgi:hypothetical protein
MPSTRRRTRKTEPRCRLTIQRINATHVLDVYDERRKAVLHAHAEGGRITLAGVTCWLPCIEHRNVGIQGDGFTATLLVRAILGPLDFAAHRTPAPLAVAA